MTATPLRNEDRDSAKEPASVSAIICTRNRPGTILQAVNSVLANDYGRFDLTVVDQSTDGATRTALDSVQDDERLTYVHTDQAGLSRAYNLGIRRSRGEYLAFTDDDCIAPSGWITSISTAFAEDEDGDLLYGQVVPAHTDPENMRLTPLLMFDEPRRLSRRDGFRVYGMGANFAARRRLFERVGYFDEALGGGGPLKSSQDFDLAYRAFRGGSVILLRPEVSIRHDGRREEDDWPSLLWNYGFGDGAFYAKHIRCGDLYALRLLAQRVGVVSGRHIIRSLRRRRLVQSPYISGVRTGINASRKFHVDTDRRLYVNAPIAEVSSHG